MFQQKLTDFYRTSWKLNIMILNEKRCILIIDSVVIKI